MALSDRCLVDERLALSDNSSMSEGPQSHQPRTDRNHGARNNRTIVVAAALGAFTTVLHVFGGGVSVARPIAESSMADEPRLLALSVWHMVSLVLGLSAVALAVAARPKHAEPGRFMVLFISTLWVGFGLAVIGVGLTQANGDLLWKLPQPILLIPVGVLGFWGTLRTT